MEEKMLEMWAKVSKIENLFFSPLHGTRTRHQENMASPEEAGVMSKVESHTEACYMNDVLEWYQ